MLEQGGCCSPVRAGYRDNAASQRAVPRHVSVLGAVLDAPLRLVVHHGQLSDDRRLPGVLLILRPLAGWELQPAAADAQQTEEQPGAGADEGCQALGVAQQRPGRECRPAGREGLGSLLT